MVKNHQQWLPGSIFDLALNPQTIPSSSDHNFTILDSQYYYDQNEDPTTPSRCGLLGPYRSVTKSKEKGEMSKNSGEGPKTTQYEKVPSVFQEFEHTFSVSSIFQQAQLSFTLFLKIGVNRLHVLKNWFLDYKGKKN